MGHQTVFVGGPAFLYALWQLGWAVLQLINITTTRYLRKRKVRDIILHHTLHAWI